MSTPRILMMGENGMEEVPFDELPDGDAVELKDHFKPVRLSGKAIDYVSQKVPSEYWIKDGLHTWLQKRADYVFRKLTSSEKSGRLKSLKYDFTFDAEGPVLERVLLG